MSLNSAQKPTSQPLQLTRAASERSASQPLASFNARAGSSASLDGKPAVPPSPYLFCGSVNGGLVVKRRDCLGPLPRQLRVALHGRGRPKPAAARARYRRDCLGDGGQQEAAEPRPGRAGDTAQHLRRRASQSRKHFETSRGLWTGIALFQLRALNPTGTDRPSGSCHNGAQKHGAEYSIERVQKGLSADWPTGRGLRRPHDINTNHYCRGGP